MVSSLDHSFLYSTIFSIASSIPFLDLYTPIVANISAIWLPTSVECPATLIISISKSILLTIANISVNISRLRLENVSGGCLFKSLFKQPIAYSLSILNISLDIGRLSLENLHVRCRALTIACSSAVLLVPGSI